MRCGSEPKLQPEARETASIKTLPFTTTTINIFALWQPLLCGVWAWHHVVYEPLPAPCYWSSWVRITPCARIEMQYMCVVKETPLFIGLYGNELKTMKHGLRQNTNPRRYSSLPPTQPLGSGLRWRGARYYAGYIPHTLFGQSLEKRIQM